jgi:hypothetical protein
MGRIQDGQVKLNSRRMELEEIESVIAKTESPSEVATVTIEAPGGVQLFACAVLNPGLTESQAESECRKAAEAYLTKWMNLHQHIFHTSLARNSSGNIDRKSLRKTAKEIFDARTKSGSIKAALKQESAPISGAEDMVVSAVSDAELPVVLCALLKRVLADDHLDVTPTTSLFTLRFDSLRSIASLQQARDLGIHESGIQDMLKELTRRNLLKPSPTVAA